jgi:aconitase B
VAHDIMLSRASPQVVEFLRPFREEGHGDEARFDRRVDAAIRAMTELRLLTPDPDADYLFTVSPAVVPLIGADEMTRMES